MLSADLKTRLQGRHYFLTFFKDRGTLTDIDMLTREQFGRNLPLDFGVQDAAWNRDKAVF